MKISQSGIQLWSKCPEAFRQRYVLKTPSKQSAAASFGTVMHFALEVYHQNNGDFELAKRTFEHYWQHPEQLGCAPEYYLPRTSWSSYRTQGQNMLNAYHEGQHWTQDEVIALEHNFVLPLGEHTLNGYIDLVRIKQTDKGLVLDVADFKTGKKAFFLRYNVQFTAYLWAVQQPNFWDQHPEGEYWKTRTAGMDVTATWISLKDSEEIDVGPRGPEDFHRLQKTVDSLAKSVEAEIFVPTLSGDACAYCDYFKECGLPDGNLAGASRGDARREMEQSPAKLLDW